MFWIFGLILCLFVGPAQSSSRTFLARLAPIGKEGQLFGLYATTGRAVSFLAPTLFGLFIVLFGTDRAGIVGILLVLAAGLLCLLPVKPPALGAVPVSADPSGLTHHPRSPSPGARPALERPDHVRGDPAAVEAAVLRQYPFAVDEALHHPGMNDRNPVIGVNRGVGDS